MLVNPSNPNVVDAPETEAAANTVGRRVEVLTASTEGDLEAAFTIMVKRQAGALIVMPDPLFFARREQLVALAARYAVPTIYPIREFTEIGGLMSYGINLSRDLHEQAGTCTGKILRGANPYISHYFCMIGQICDEARLLFCRRGTPWHLETRECLNDYLTTKVAKRSRWARG